jgi:hypothetical protein
LPNIDGEESSACERLKLHVERSGLANSVSFWLIFRQFVHPPAVIQKWGKEGSFAAHGQSGANHLRGTPAFRCVTFLVTILITLSFTSRVAKSQILAGSPVNDNFSNAIVLTGYSLSVMGLNLMATSEPTEPAHEDHPATHSTWWRWVAPQNGVVQIKSLSNLEQPNPRGIIFLPPVYLGIYTGSQLLSCRVPLTMELTRSAPKPTSSGSLREKRTIWPRIITIQLRPRLSRLPANDYFITGSKEAILPSENEDAAGSQNVLVFPQPINLQLSSPRNCDLVLQVCQVEHRHISHVNPMRSNQICGALKFEVR